MKTNASRAPASGLDLKFSVPSDLSFFDLRLRWQGGGKVGFDWDAIERLCEASSIDVDLIRYSGPENIGKLISYWYLLHRLNGGAPDSVKEEAMVLARTGDFTLDQFVHSPGHA